MLSRYFSEFGDKESCLSDLQNYIDLLQPNEVVEFLECNLPILDFEKRELHEKVRIFQYSFFMKLNLFY